MPYPDLLRVPVFLTGAEATALGAIAALAVSRTDDTTALLVAAAWWLGAFAPGLRPREPRRAAGRGAGATPPPARASRGRAPRPTGCATRSPGRARRRRCPTTRRRGS